MKLVVKWQQVKLHRVCLTFQDIKGLRGREASLLTGLTPTILYLSLTPF